MPDLTRKQLADELGVSEKILRRLLPRISDLQCNRIGRRITFSPKDVARIREAMRCPYPNTTWALSSPAADHHVRLDMVGRGYGGRGWRFA
jgi:hypothetical protein